MTQEHPITPPPELVQQWMHEASGQPPGPDARVIATQAARWGADQELEACCEWLSNRSSLTERLRTVRRPKPPSLKEQALEQLKCVDSDLRQHGIINTDFIRRALETLPDEQ